MLSPALLFLLLAAAASAAAPPVIAWASEPVGPGEALLLLGGPFSPDCVLSVAPTTSSILGRFPHTLRISPVDNQTTESSLKAIIPSDFPADVFSLTVDCGSGSSEPYLLNAPQLYWVQGDLGDAATADGGWLRVQGNGVAFLDAEALALRSRLRSLRRRLQRVRALGGDLLGGDASDENILVIAEELSETMARLRAHQLSPRSASTVVRLTPADASARLPTIDLPATMTNATQWSVHVPLPAGLKLAPGVYNVSVSNGRGPQGLFVSLDSFVSPAAPHVTSIELRSSAQANWLPPYVFTVGRGTQPAQWPFAPNATSDAEVQAALAKALTAGGGTVFFPAGTYFLDQPLIIPPRTVIAGESATSTAIYFTEKTNYTAPAAYFQLNDTLASHQPSGTAPWGVRDFTVAVTGFHFMVFLVSNYTNGFFMDRVVARADAFFAGNNAGTINGPGAEATHSRWANWTLEQPGNLVQINANNFRITKCDLWGTYNVITSFWSNGKYNCNSNTFPNSCHGATYGYIADNTIYNGGASHFMNQWRQVIFERNIATGASPIAMGNAVGTGPDGGYDHHILHSDNIVRLVWGNDREMITYDDAGGSYWGTLASASGTTITTSANCKSAGDMHSGGWAGGVIVVLNGTGAGQWSRIVVPGIGPEPYNPNNRTWIMDRPFAVAPGPSSFVQILPFRGRNIFTGDTFEDGGAFQFYGHAIDNIVADNTLERMSGVISWGQWRGWLPAEEERLGGQMNNGLQPNLRNQFLRNTFIGSFSIPNYNNSGSYDPFYGRRFFATQETNNAPATQYTNFFLVFRNNTGGGGYDITQGAGLMVVEGGDFEQDVQTAAQGPCVLLPRGAGDGSAYKILVRNVGCAPAQSV